VSVVVVAAHPCAESYATAVRGRVMDGLTAGGHHGVLLDLYATAYDPHLPLPTDHADVLETATSLVLVHPTWWTSQPAILLAWLDQASASGLPTVRVLVSVTTLGGSRLANFIGGESGRRVVQRAVRSRCVQRPPHRRLAFYGLDRSTLDARTAFLDRVERRIGTMVR
jgi:putative NADPH-quinone reductase